MFNDFIGNTLSVDFFDYAFTFANRSTTVACCLPNNTIEEATCGKGASCAGQCSALGASLCPSGNCTSDPKTCQFEFDKILPEHRLRRQSDATESSSSLRSCYPKCKVKKDPSCCYHQECYNKRPKLCDWINDLTGMINHFQIQNRNSRPEMSFAWQPAEGKVVL